MRTGINNSIKNDYYSNNLKPKDFNLLELESELSLPVGEENFLLSEKICFNEIVEVLSIGYYMKFLDEFDLIDINQEALSVDC